MSSKSCRSSTRTMKSNNFHIRRATPITFQAFSGHPDSPIPVQQSFRMPRPNTAGFTATQFDLGNELHQVSQPAPAGDERYVPSRTSMASALVHAPEPISATEDWSFQPDPNIEGHWIAVLPSHCSPQDRLQAPQMDLPTHYPEQPNELRYQVSLLFVRYSALLISCNRCLHKLLTTLRIRRHTSPTSSLEALRRIRVCHHRT